MMQYYFINFSNNIYFVTHTSTSRIIIDKYYTLYIYEYNEVPMSKYIYKYMI